MIPTTGRAGGGLRYVGLVLLAGWLGACSGVTPYGNEPEKNLYVRRDTAPHVRAAVDIYSVDRRCRAQYQGTVDLEAPTTPVGLATGEPSLLVFSFTTSSFFRGRHSISRDALLAPEPGHRYEARASYRDDIYRVTIRARAPGRAMREVKLIGLDGCHPAR